MILMTHPSVHRNGVVVVVVVVALHSLVVHQVLLVSIRARFAIDHLPVIASNITKKRVKKRVNNGVYLIQPNNDYKAQKRRRISEKEKAVKFVNLRNLK